MFKNTNYFFEEVASGNVANIDIKRYVNSITDNHKLEYLKSLDYDLSFFIFIYSDELLAEITDKDWQNKFEYYKQRGEKTPVIIFENVERKINKSKGLPYEHLPEFNERFDVEKIFYPYALFCIRQLENYIKELIKKNENINTTPLKHENIFCNNGFELFNHILKEYVKPTKGRQSDLIFYHRKMYDNKPQYIHQRPTEFFNWFQNNYDEVFGQLKTLSQVETPQRNKDYSNALNWFKQQPQQVP